MSVLLTFRRSNLEEKEKLDIILRYVMFTNRAQGPYWGVLALGRSTDGQYFPIRLELARAMLVCFLLKHTSGHLNSKGSRRNVI